MFNVIFSVCCAHKAKQAPVNNTDESNHSLTGKNYLNMESNPWYLLSQAHQLYII